DYEPQSTDQDMTEERLITLTENELDKRVNATVEYEADIADLEHVPGLENKKIRYGDTIKIKDTKFNPPLYLEARVHTMDRSIVDKSNKKVTLGDFIEYTEEEVHDIWNELKKEIQNKIDANDLDEYTYRKQIIDSKDTEAKEGAKADVEAGKVGLPGGSIKDTISGKHLDIDLGVFGASPQFRSSELWLDGVWLSFNIGGSGNPTDKFNFDYYVFRPSKKYLTVDGAAALGVVDGNI
ncbi:phage tail spike protein, partial [Virgibacillus salarius]